jgi:ornithine cyclodeaminase
LAPGRGTDEEITLFKSVGTAVEDLAAAMLVWRRLGGK